MTFDRSQIPGIDIFHKLIALVDIGTVNHVPGIWQFDDIMRIETRCYRDQEAEAGLPVYAKTHRQLYAYRDTVLRDDWKLVVRRHALAIDLDGSFYNHETEEFFSGSEESYHAGEILSIMAEFDEQMCAEDKELCCAEPGIIYNTDAQDLFDGSRLDAEYKTIVAKQNAEKAALVPVTPIR